MKFTITFILSCLLLTACATGEKAISEPDDLVAASPPSEKDTTIQGSFKSTKGVMTKLSCYCSNGGTITAESGEQFLVCFDDKVEFPNCTNLTVIGKNIIRILASEENNPCPSGHLSFLIVKDFKCVE